MTLEEAIKHCEVVASDYSDAKKIHAHNHRFEKSYKCEMSVEEHRQLAEWLRELKAYKDRQILINKSWQELIRYKEGIEKIKMRSQSYREHGETVLASGMEQALDILTEVNADEGNN